MGFLKVGRTLLHVENESMESASNDDKKCFGTWREIHGNEFKVRSGQDYSLQHEKSASKECLYTPVSVDIYSTSCKLHHIGQFIDWEKLEGTNSSGWSKGIPRFLVIHTMCPSYAPGIFTNIEDGIGYAVTIVAEISERTLERVQLEQETPVIGLLREFIQKNSEEMRGRFKGIVKAKNIDQLPLNYLMSGLMHRFNTTPFLLRAETTKMYKGQQYAELDVDVHLFNSMSRQAFYHTHGMVSQIKADYAFLIEGRENDELPECVLLALNISQLQNISPKPFPEELLSEIGIPQSIEPNEIENSNKE